MAPIHCIAERAGAADPSSFRRADGEDSLAAVAPSLQRTILLAEDDGDLRLLMRAFLEAEGYRVLACEDGRRALQMFQKTDDIELLISDVEMPHLKGPDLAQLVRSLRPSLPVILMSGAQLTDELQSRIASVSWIFLAKPFAVPRMLAAIRQVLD